MQRGRIHREVLHRARGARHLMLPLLLLLLLVPIAGRAGSLDAPDAPEGLRASDWAGIRKAREDHLHAVHPTEVGYLARNPSQQWQTHFDGRGFTTRPDGDAWTWGLELERYGFAGRERAVEGSARVHTEGGRVVYDWDDGLEEWYINDRRGLEHGYTVRERRSIAHDEGEAGVLRFTLAVRGGLSPEVGGDGRSVQFVGSDGSVAVTYAGLVAFDADGRFLPVRFERNGKWLTLAVDERGARYPLTIDPIAQQSYLKASNTEERDGFGAVAVSGDTVVVGAQNEDSSATGVDGNQADNSAFQSGAAYVFVRSGTTWSQQAYLKASNTDSLDRFGGSVAISGDTIVVGAFTEDSNATGADGNQADNSAVDSGAAYVFVRSGTTWSQQAYLKASNTDPGDGFGFRVAVSGDIILVGALREDSNAIGVEGNQADNSAIDSGAAYVFVRSGSTWSQQAYLKASNTDPEDWFGCSLAVSDDTVVVGAFREDSSATGVDGNQVDDSASFAGAAYVFVRNDTTWSQQAYLKASNTDQNDDFGYSVAVSADTIVVGAHFESSSATGVGGNEADDGALAAGAAYVFVRSGTIWSQQAYLKASNTDVDDFFGTSVAVSGDTVVVGAPGENGSAANQNDNSETNSGAVYIFVRNGTSWSQQHYLKASNADPGDEFGNSVGVSGETVLVATYREGSGATGVDGDQSDNSVFDAGAAYVFVLSPSAIPLLPSWSLAVLIALLAGFGAPSARRCGTGGLLQGNGMRVQARP